ncbi:unnamed protein product [Polarella glacialis]|uniref:Calmodulin n=1 Tax=Polarella glacialis TaxID=89957 RepID=A0A813HSN5_POLGL|nr:unnamed protein product [Polarella glacialis]CAE8650029.1 unnamed protein product [Polarella glacialis]
MGMCQSIPDVSDADEVVANAGQGQGATEPSGPWAAAGINKDHYDHILAEFVSMDGNGDQKLSRKEFGEASRMPEFLGMSAADAEHMFTKVDVDHSGEISFAEFLGFMGKRKDHAPLKIQVPPEKQRLEANMRSLGFELCRTEGGKLGVAGDGNCQFYSLAWEMYKDTSKHAAVRSAVLEYLRGPSGADFATFYAPEFPSQPQSFGGYLDLMAQDYIWGDQITLQAAADVFNLKIHVLTSAEYDAFAQPPGSGECAGQSYGAIQRLIPTASDAASPAKKVWISFAAQHYSPIMPTQRTPRELRAL